jgi:hypothetical protein
MRVSIWQQFGSNHSSSFTVVGEFPTEIDANQAADELRRIVQSIADYYAANPEIEEKWNSEGAMPPTPPEFEMAAKYDVPINIEYGLDWIWGKMLIDEAVIQFGKLVFVTHPGDTWHGGHPFDYIVEKLGGKARVDGMQDAGADHQEPHVSTWIKQLICTAPDEFLGQAIASEITEFLQESQKAWQSAGKIPIPNAPWQPTGVPWYMQDASTGGGHVESKGTKLIFTDWNFRKLAYGLPALAAYLREKDCTDIQYELDSSIDEDD